MFEPKLLTRDEFRSSVFARDNHACVVCGEPAHDAHHIMERRLWPDGGSYLENGASVCAQHHLACEMTHLSVEDVRAACGITHVVLPPHLYADQHYDKWGNPILSDGQRLKGELFYDESVQKVLERGGVLDRFTYWVKYPRTHHIPWSPGIHSADRVIESMATFEGQRVIVTEKKDGENTTLYCDHMHARSVESGSHPSRSWVKNFWSGMRANIPTDGVARLRAGAWAPAHRQILPGRSPRRSGGFYLPGSRRLCGSRAGSGLAARETHLC